MEVPQATTTGAQDGTRQCVLCTRVRGRDGRYGEPAPIPPLAGAPALCPACEALVADRLDVEARPLPPAACRHCGAAVAADAAFCGPGHARAYFARLEAERAFLRGLQARRRAG